MTPEQQALYQAILDRPNDLAPRLVYADWLDETGLEENVVQAREIREAIASGEVRCVEESDSTRLSRYGWAYSRNGLIELLYTTPEYWASRGDHWVRNWPINQVVFPRRLNLDWQQSLTPTGVQVRCFLDFLPDVVDYSDQSRRKSYQTHISYLPGMTESSAAATKWPDLQARRVAGSFQPYEDLWPGVCFHSVVRLDPITNDNPRYSLHPRTDKPLGDLFERHAQGNGRDGAAEPPANSR